MSHWERTLAKRRNADCCFACSPQATAAIPLPRLRALIEDSAHICHTCQYLFRSPLALKVLRQHQGEVEARFLETCLLLAAGDDLFARLPG